MKIIERSLPGLRAVKQGARAQLAVALRLEEKGAGIGQGRAASSRTKLGEPLS